MRADGKVKITLLRTVVVTVGFRVEARRVGFVVGFDDVVEDVVVLVDSVVDEVDVDEVVAVLVELELGFDVDVVGLVELEVDLDVVVTVVVDGAAAELVDVETVDAIRTNRGELELVVVRLADVVVALTVDALVGVDAFRVDPVVVDGLTVVVDGDRVAPTKILL